MPTALSFDDCRSAAREVRRAEHGRQAYATARPRGVTGIIRARGPLALMLLIAQREGRLIWRDVHGFALLEPPLVDRPVRGRGIRHQVLRLLDRHWELIIFTGPPLLGLLAAAACLPLRPLWSVGLLLALAVMLYVVVLMAGGAVAFVVWLFRTFGRAPRAGELAADSLPAYRYSMRLCHCADPAGADDLLARVSRGLDRLVEASMTLAAAERGAMLDGVRIVTALTCLTRGITTTAMRTRLSTTRRVTTPYGTGGDVVFLEPRDQADDAPRRFVSTASFLLWYVFGGAAVLLLCAWVVAQRESAACGSDCVGRPATYVDAVRWLFGAGGDLRPGASGVWVMGLAATVARWLTIPVAAVAVLQIWRRGRHDRELAEKADRVIARRPRVLVLVVTRVEFEAVIAVAASIRPSLVAWPDHRGGHSVLRLGEFGGCDVILARSGPGPESARGIQLTTNDLIVDLKPRYAVLTGICFGLKEREEQLGDVVLATQVRDIDHRKFSEPASEVEERPRGDWLGASPEPFSAMLLHGSSWSGPIVHVGPMVGSGTLYDSPTRRAELIAAHPDAFAADMECHVFGATAVKRRTDWCVVRGISDLGMDKRDADQRRAAEHAARLVLEVIGSGALARPAVAPSGPLQQPGG